jgi:carboxylate-amine ligase
MATRFTVGIEEEFQLVDGRTGELRSRAESILKKGTPYFGSSIKPEMLQTTIELVSDVLPDIETARTSLRAKRAALAQFVAQDGLALISAGTHPGAFWQDQTSSHGERYEALMEEFQDLVRSDVIFGLHVHVGVSDRALAIKIFNQVRTWLPHLLALSTNSPFWEGRMTGLKSYRSVQWKRFIRSGVPEVLTSWEDFEMYVNNLVEMDAIEDGKEVWWDVRPHAFYHTIEFRICDMPATLDDTLAIAALCQALVAKLALLNERGQGAPLLRSCYIEENKWRAIRYGLEAEVLDFVGKRRLSMRDALRELLDFVDEVVDELGSRCEMEYLWALLDDPRGTGADRQIAIYQESRDIQQVLRFLLAQTLQGVVPATSSSVSQ